MGEKKINVLVFYPVKGTLGKKNFQRIRLCSCDPNTVSGFLKGFCDVYSMFPGVHYSVAMLITLGNKGIFFSLYFHHFKSFRIFFVTPHVWMNIVHF